MLQIYPLKYIWSQYSRSNIFYPMQSYISLYVSGLMAWSRWVTEVSCFWKPSFWMPWKPEKIRGKNSQVPYFWGTHSRERRNWWCRWFNFLEEPPCSQMQQRTASTHYWPLNLPLCNPGHCWAGLWLHFSSKVFIQKSLEHFSWTRFRQKQHPHSHTAKPG